MAILGSIIKGAIDLRGSIVGDTSPVEDQQNVLRSLLDKAKDTAFGKYYGFTTILESEQTAKKFTEVVPFFDYHTMKEEWWDRTISGLPDIT